MDIQATLKMLPSVEKVLEDKRIDGQRTLFSRKGITLVVRQVIARFRENIRAGRCAYADEGTLEKDIITGVVTELDRLVGDQQRRVINATGVVLHTNLGRAVLGGAVCDAIVKAASGYVDLEMELVTGERTSRLRRIRHLLAMVTGAEDALVVNNNAAAVLLAVNTFARDGAVAVSRGEMVEIGGSFRLPEILARAAGRVIEIGTTNKTHLGDYDRAIDEGATLLLKVHTSNYRIVGYANEVSLRELAELGKRRGVPVMYDQGSGVLYPLETKGVEGEEHVAQVLASGVDIVSFSADKVLGGPQGGILLGSTTLIEHMHRNHLSRALRIDKLTIAGLERLLLQYWRGEFESMPVLNMITESIGSLRGRAERFTAKLEKLAGEQVQVSVTEGESSIGGGSYPINPLRTVLVEITLHRAEKLAVHLRTGDPAVLVRVRGNSVFLDLRTVAVGEEMMLFEQLKKGIGSILGRE